MVTSLCPSNRASASSQLDAYCSSGPSPTEAYYSSPRKPQVVTSGVAGRRTIHLLGLDRRLKPILQSANTSHEQIIGITVGYSTLYDPLGIPPVDLMDLLENPTDLRAYAPTESLGVFDAIARVGANYVIDLRSQQALTGVERNWVKRAALSIGAGLDFLFPTQSVSIFSVENKKYQGVTPSVIPVQESATLRSMP